MSSQNGVKHVPAGTGPMYWGPGDEMRFLITGAETGGAFFMAEVSVPPGGGPPPHVHSREDESFYLFSGTLIVQVGGKTLHASPGDFVHLPRGIAHTFKNTSKEYARMLVTVTPAGLEKFFEEVFSPAVEGSPAPLMNEGLIARAMAAAAKHGLQLLPPA